MKLILKDYLATLKEEQELEKLLENILFMDNYENIISPQKGVTQFGVDFSAEKNNNLYLFVLKQGDIDRNTWDSGPNGVRATLNTIKDTYISQRINVKNKNVKIILCCNGTLKQNIEVSWNGYINQQKDKKLSFEFWGIDELVKLTEKYLVNEYIFDENLKSDLRKVLYFISEDYSLNYFKLLTKNLINKINLENKKQKSYKKSIITFTMLCRMCITYAEEQNLTIAVNMSEKAMITYWNFLVKNNLLEKPYECMQLLNLSSYYKNCCKRFVNEIKRVCHMKPSFSIYNPFEYQITIFEVVGIIATYTYYIYYYYGLNKEVKENVNLLIELINNNTAFYYPPYDLNSIEINILIFLLSQIGNNQVPDFVDLLLNKITLKIIQNNYYPVEYENYPKAISMLFNKNEEKCKATLLITNLFEWLYVLKKEKDINKYVSILYKRFPNITFNSVQIDLNCEKLYFNGDISNSIISFVLNFEDINETRKQIYEIKKNYLISRYNYDKYSILPYLFILSRNYRLPLPSCLIYNFLE